MSSFIAAVSYYLPDEVLTNEDLNRLHPEWSVDKISSKTGILSRRIAGENECAGDMAIRAGKKLLKEHSIDPNTIDFLLYCTQSPDYFLPTTACVIQNELGLPTSIGALDFNLGCSGYIYGLSLANGLIMSGAANKIILITSETYSKYIHPNDKSNKTIFGDAASATLITKEVSPYKIGKFVFGTDGRGAANLIVRNGASRFPNKTVDDSFDGDGNFVRNDACLYMNGGEIFNFTSQAVPILVSSLLQKNNCELVDVDLFVFHQANKFMLDFIRKKIGIPQDKFIYYLEGVGNTVSSTIPITFKERILKDNVQGKLLLAGFGVGYSWAGVIIEKEC
ncbi:MAG: 3-oxoacyl-ACP synthase III family protein [Breznakibacter sp.]